MCIESVMPSSHPILCRPLLLLPPIPPSIRVFSNESTLRMRWPNYNPSSNLVGLILYIMCTRYLPSHHWCFSMIPVCLTAINCTSAGLLCYCFIPFLSICPITVVVFPYANVVTFCPWLKLTSRSLLPSHPEADYFSSSLFPCSPLPSPSLHSGLLTIAWLYHHILSD